MTATDKHTKRNKQTHVRSMDKLQQTNKHMQHTWSNYFDGRVDNVTFWSKRKSQRNVIKWDAQMHICSSLSSKVSSPYISKKQRQSNISVNFLAAIMFIFVSLCTITLFERKKTRQYFSAELNIFSQCIMVPLCISSFEGDKSYL